MKEFMIVPPPTPSGATTPSEPPYTTTFPLEEIEMHLVAPITREQVENYFINLSPTDQQNLISALKKLTAKKPCAPTKKKAPDTNQLSFDDIG